MADRWAVASGNWSSTATWNGGTLPTASDDVYADGYTVTIDQNVTVLSIRTTQRTGGTAGGSFVLNGGITLTADVRAGSSSCLTYASVASSFIVGNVYGSNTATSCRGIVISGGAGTLTITGNIFGGSQSSTDGVLFFTSSPLNVIGNITGGSGASCHGITNGTSYSSTVTVTGNVTGGTVSNGGGILLNSGSPTVLVNGNVTAGFNQAGVFLSAGVLTVNGNITSTTNAVAINSPTFRFNGLGFSGPTGQCPFYSSNVLIHATNAMQLEYRVNNSGVAGVARSLYTGGQNLGQPTAANVRAGSTFGVSNEFTGTLVVPSAQFVAFGTPVDSGVGTLQYLTMSDLQSALQSNAPSVNERTLSDTNPLSFSWPVSGVITGQVSKNNGAYANVQGAISYLRFEGNRHYYSLAYNAADRPTQEGVARYKFTDGTYTRYANLRVYPAPNNTAIESINSRLPANPASAQQITSLQNNAPTEIF